MKKTIKNKNTEKGSILVFVLVMVVIVAITMSSLLTYISSQLNYSKDKVERERAFQIAEAGIYYYRWYLAHQVAGKTAQQIQTFWDTGSPLGVAYPYPEIEYKDPEGGGIGKYKLEVKKPEAGSTIVTVKSTGWTYLKPSAQRVVEVRFRRPSWSENSVLANDDMRFGEGTTINGKIQSNQGIRFDGVANNIVSSSLSSYSDPDHNGANEFGVHTHVNPPPGSGINDNQRPLEAPPSAIANRTDVFQAGRAFPVPQMDFNSLVSDLSFMRASATIKFDNKGAGRRIILKVDGTMDVCKVNAFDSTTNAITNYNKNSGSGTCTTCSGTCLANYPIPASGVVYVANNIWLEGTINNKRVSFVAAELPDEPGYTGGSGGNKCVFLGMNNLLYTNFDGKDIIGIIAQDDVEVIKDSLDTLTLDAAMLAKEGRVGRDSYGNDKDTITVNGSIATYSRYGFAYVNSGTGTFSNGYEIRNINFDNNLLYYPPPYFPTGTEYSIDQWDEL